MEKNQKRVRFIVHSAAIAALYVVLTFLANALGLASGAIQVRISEALVAFLFFSPAAIPGLTIGCLLANIVTGCALWDVIFGTIATFIGAILGYSLKKYKYAVVVPNIISNTLIVPFVLMFVYNLSGAWWYFALTVGIGEIISCAIFGTVLLKALEKRGKLIFK